MIRCYFKTKNILVNPKNDPEVKDIEKTISDYTKTPERKKALKEIKIALNRGFSVRIEDVYGCLIAYKEDNLVHLEDNRYFNQGNRSFSEDAFFEKLNKVNLKKYEIPDKEVLELSDSTITENEIERILWDTDELQATLDETFDEFFTSDYKVTIDGTEITIREIGKDVVYKSKLENLTIKIMEEYGIKDGIKDIVSQVVYTLDNSFAYEEAYELFWESVNSLFDRVLPDVENFYLNGSNLNWRHSSGYKTFVGSGSDAIKSVIKDIDCNLYISEDFYGEYIALRYTHHDCPTGSYVEIYPHRTIAKEMVDDLTMKEVNLIIKEWDIFVDKRQSKRDALIEYIIEEDVIDVNNLK